MRDRPPLELELGGVRDRGVTPSPNSAFWKPTRGKQSYFLTTCTESTSDSFWQIGGV